MLRSRRLASIVSATACLPAFAVGQETSGAVAFQQACLDATTDAVVLNVAAHPDDEAARTMVLLRHGSGLRTVTLYSTCGEGGQNAIGREIGARLAAIRVAETLAAAEHTGTRVRWLGFPDFGYSKSMEETLAIWGRDALLQRMEEAVAAIDPDVVFTNHGTDRGHGHHRATAFAIRDICARRGLPLLERVFRPGEFEGPGEAGDVAQFALDASAVDPVRGTTFAAQAYRGWTEHATQGPWGSHDPQRVRVERWRQVRAEGAQPAADPLAALPDVFDEPALGAAAAAAGHPVAALRAELDAFGEDRSRAEHVAAARRLLPVLRGLQRAAPSVRLARRIEALERVVVIGAGVTVEAFAVDRRVRPGGACRLRVAVRGSGVAGVVVRCGDTVVDAAAAEREARERQGAAAGPAVGGAAPAADAPPPGWVELVVPVGPAAGDRVAELRGVRTLSLHVELTLDGLPLSLERPVTVGVAPQLELAFAREVVGVPSGRGPWARVLSLEVGWHGEAALVAPVAVRHPAGLQVEAIPAEVRLSPQQPRARVLVRVMGDGERPERRGELSATVGDSDRARVELQPMALSIAPGLHVGLVRGPDDTMLRFFEDVGIPFADLDETALAVADLGAFSTVLLDIRAYHHRPDLGHHRERLLRFVEGGGRLVAFYHKESEWNAAEGKPLLVPFALKVGRGRVSEEDAAVTVLAADHPLLAAPHRIAAADFDGWVQERGLNFPAEWDGAWTPLLSMHDRGEEPLLGGLLHAGHGSGDVVYCALALYRQLREGHEGAARLTVNLLTPPASNR